MSNFVALPEQIASHGRQLAALRLRLQGMSYAQIAQKLGYATHSGASNAIYRALDELNELTQTTALQLRTAEHERINTEVALLHQTRREALDQHYNNPDDPRWLMLVLQVTDRILRASELIIRLYGLDNLPALEDKATPITVIAPVTPAEIDAAHTPARPTVIEHEPD